MKFKKVLKFLGLAMLFLVVWAIGRGCATPGTEPRVVKETVIVPQTVVVKETVIVEGTPRVVEKVVKETVVVEKVVKETVLVEGTPMVVERVVTATPIPTLEPASGLTTQGWMQVCLPQTQIIANAMEIMSGLYLDPLPGDDTWLALLAVQVDRIREADAILREVVPPEECREAHEVMLDATGHFVLGAKLGLRGAREADLNLMGQAAEHMEAGGIQINLATLLVEALLP